MGEYYRGVIKGGTRSLEFLGLLSRYKPVPPRVPKRVLGPRVVGLQCCVLGCFRGYGTQGGAGYLPSKVRGLHTGARG